MLEAIVSLPKGRRLMVRLRVSSQAPQPPRLNVICYGPLGPAAEAETETGEGGMATTVKQMLEAANAVVPKVTPAQAKEMIAKADTLVVDIRDWPELAASGKIAGAVHVSRGMLEFRADADLPSHDKNFSKDKTVILYCGSGGRAALAGKMLKNLGYANVCNLGGFKDWADSGGAVEKV